MTRRSVRRDPACQVVVENGSRRGKVNAVAEPDLGKHLVERNLSAKRRKVLVPDVRLDAGFFEQGPQQVRFYEVGCGVELFRTTLEAYRTRHARFGHHLHDAGTLLSSTHFAPAGGEPWLLAKGPPGVGRKSASVHDRHAAHICARAAQAKPPTGSHSRTAASIAARRVLTIPS